jgi:elongator complex protein 5
VILSHHTDIPLPAKFPHYPSAEPLLSHISTTVLRVSSFGHYRLKALADSQALPDPIAKDRSADGVVSTFGSNTPLQLIVSLQYRRKSGRTLIEKYSFNLSSGQVGILGPPAAEDDAQETSGVDFGTTFNLGITQRQKQSKEDLVLPHFLAQRDVQAEEMAAAGHIDYTLDAEDDFDDEEDVDEDLLI